MLATSVCVSFTLQSNRRTQLRPKSAGMAAHTVARVRGTAPRFTSLSASGICSKFGRCWHVSEWVAANGAERVAGIRSCFVAVLRWGIPMDRSHQALLRNTSAPGPGCGSEASFCRLDAIHVNGRNHRTSLILHAFPRCNAFLLEPAIAASEASYGPTMRHVMASKVWGQTTRDNDVRSS